MKNEIQITLASPKSMTGNVPHDIVNFIKNVRNELTDLNSEQPTHVLFARNEDWLYPILHLYLLQKLGGKPDLKGHALEYDKIEGTGNPHLLVKVGPNWVWSKVTLANRAVTIPIKNTALGGLTNLLLAISVKP